MNATLSFHDLLYTNNAMSLRSTCAHCESPFTVTMENILFCSSTCADIDQNSVCSDITEKMIRTIDADNSDDVEYDYEYDYENEDREFSTEEQDAYDAYIDYILDQDYDW